MRIRSRLETNHQCPFSHSTHLTSLLTGGLDSTLFCFSLSGLLSPLQLPNSPPSLQVFRSTTANSTIHPTHTHSYTLSLHFHFTHLFIHSFSYFHDLLSWFTRPIQPHITFFHTLIFTFDLRVCPSFLPAPHDDIVTTIIFRETTATLFGLP